MLAYCHLKIDDINGTKQVEYFILKIDYLKLTARTTGKSKNTDFGLH
jgi:hypothetical protein